MLDGVGIGRIHTGIPRITVGRELQFKHHGLTSGTIKSVEEKPGGKVQLTNGHINIEFVHEHVAHARPMLSAVEFENGAIENSCACCCCTCCCFTCCQTPEGQSDVTPLMEQSDVELCQCVEEQSAEHGEATCLSCFWSTRLLLPLRLLFESKAAFSSKKHADKNVVVKAGRVKVGEVERTVRWIDAFTDGEKKIAKVEDKLGGKVLLDDGTAFENPSNVVSNDWDHWSQAFLIYNLVFGFYNLLAVYYSFLQGNPAAQNHWESYEMFILFMAQSNFFETGIQLLFTPDIGGIIDRHGRVPDWHDTQQSVGMMLICGPLLPAVATHCIWMCIAYIWVLAPFIFFAYPLFCWLPFLYGRPSAVVLCTKAKQLVISCITGAVLATLVMAMFQTMIAYGILLYSGENYLQTIVLDWKLRSSAGYWDCMYSKVHSIFSFI